MLKVVDGSYGEIEGVKGRAEGQSDQDVQSGIAAIHFPHKLSKGLRAVGVEHEGVKDALQATVAKDVKLLQSMAFYKARGVEGQAPHQDETYIPTRDRSLAGLWVALDDATEENGCLWVIPGSHRAGVIWPNKPTEDPRYAHGGESYGHPYSEKDWVCVPVPSGSAVLFNGYLLHRSLANRGGSFFRRALVMHYCSAQSLNPWTNDGRFEVKGEGDLSDYTMVCGRDPYEGLRRRQDVLRPFVRNKEHGDRLDGEALELHVIGGKEAGGAAAGGGGAAAVEGKEGEEGS